MSWTHFLSYKPRMSFPNCANEGSGRHAIRGTVDDRLGWMSVLYFAKALSAILASIKDDARNVGASCFLCQNDFAFACFE